MVLLSTVTTQCCVTLLSLGFRNPDPGPLYGRQAGIGEESWPIFSGKYLENFSFQVAIKFDVNFILISGRKAYLGLECTVPIGLT